MLEFLLPPHPGREIHEACIPVRKIVPPIERDPRFSRDLKKIHSLIAFGELLYRVKEIGGN
jgi:hypothetical protein